MYDPMYDPHVALFELEEGMFTEPHTGKANLADGAIAQPVLVGPAWGQVDAGKTLTIKRRPIDFVMLENMRKNMLLSVTSLVKLLGVSRVTYYNWLKGKQPRGFRATKVREVIRKLINCIDYYHWPTPEVLLANQEQRMNLLLDCFKKLDNPEQPVIV